MHFTWSNKIWFCPILVLALFFLPDYRVINHKVRCVCVFVCFFLSPDKEMDPERESGLPKVMWPASGCARNGLYTSRISLRLFLSYLHLEFPKSRVRIHSFFESTLKLVGLNRQKSPLLWTFRSSSNMQMSVNLNKYCWYLVQLRYKQVSLHKKISEYYLGLK